MIEKCFYSIFDKRWFWCLGTVFTNILDLFKLSERKVLIRYLKYVLKVNILNIKNRTIIGVIFLNSFLDIQMVIFVIRILKENVKRNHRNVIFLIYVDRK